MYVCLRVCFPLGFDQLDKYVPAFEAEEIDGSLLKEADHEILGEDLGVQSKLHRLKILSAVQLLTPNS
eukprot:m.30612 g.30612  ORF g.30612 m.30612 type:complete len:68 (+) comp9487_c0_seq2:1215-1418(+)